MPSAFPYCSIFFLFLNSVASFQIPRFLAESEKNMPKCHWMRRKLGWSLRSVNGWILPGYHIEIFLKCLDKTNRLEFLRWYLTFLVDLWWSLLSLVLIFGYVVNIVFRCFVYLQTAGAAPWCWGNSTGQSSDIASVYWWWTYGFIIATTLAGPHYTS